MHKIVLLGLTVSLIAACGGGSGGGDAASKSLFSSWTEASTGYVINLTGGSFGNTLPFTFILVNGAKCGCDVNLVGTEASGTYVVSSCQYTGGGPGNPNCSALNSNGSYSKTGSTLKLCSSSGSSCETYN